MTVADMSEYPFISFKVKASEAIPMRIQIFEASEAFNVSGAMNQAAFNSEPLPVDEWVTLTYDFSEKFKHVASGITTYGDSSQIFQFLMVPGPGATTYGDFSKWVGTVHIDDIKIGKAAAPKTKVDSYEQNFSDFDVTNSAKIWSETRAFDDGQRAPYTFSIEEETLKVDVDKNFTPRRATITLYRSGIIFRQIP
jgi:hypothetical protein